jgi:integrase
LVGGRETADGITYHTLRHTFASWLMVRDINPLRIAKLLGNSLEMVLTTYGHLQPADNRAAIASLSGAVTFPVLPAPNAQVPS